MRAVGKREQLDRGTLLEALDFHSYYTASIKLSLGEKGNIRMEMALRNGDQWLFFVTVSQYDSAGALCSWHSAWDVWCYILLLVNRQRVLLFCPNEERPVDVLCL
jgi:hypothetical protein